MGTIATVPINNFSGGPTTSPEFAVPAGAQNVTVDFDGSTMLDPTMTVDTVIQFAPDGVTWRDIAGANFQCGSKMRDGVTPRALYSLNTDIPPDASPDAKLRGTLTVPVGALTTTLHIKTIP